MKLTVTADPLMRPVRAFSAADPTLTVATGLCVAVADHPTLVIRTNSGHQVHWAAHLCEVTGEEVNNDDIPAGLSWAELKAERDTARRAAVDFEQRLNRVEALIDEWRAASDRIDRESPSWSEGAETLIDCRLDLYAALHPADPDDSTQQRDGAT